MILCMSSSRFPVLLLCRRALLVAQGQDFLLDSKLILQKRFMFPTSLPVFDRFVGY